MSSAVAASAPADLVRGHARAAAQLEQERRHRGSVRRRGEVPQKTAKPGDAVLTQSGRGEIGFWRSSRRSRRSLRA